MLYMLDLMRLRLSDTDENGVIYYYQLLHSFYGNRLTVNPPSQWGTYCLFHLNLTNHHYRYINLHVREAMISIQAFAEVGPDIVCVALVFLQFLAGETCHD